MNTLIIAVQTRDGVHAQNSRGMKTRRWQITLANYISIMWNLDRITSHNGLHYVLQRGCAHQ